VAILLDFIINLSRSCYLKYQDSFEKPNLFTITEYNAAA